MRVTLGAFRGHFEVTLSTSTSNFMCDACVMHTCTGLVGPKTGKVKKLVVFKAFLEGQRSKKHLQKTNSSPAPAGGGCLWGHFGGTLGSLWVYSNGSVSLYDHFGVIVESLWMCEGRFSKNIHFPNRF